MDFRPGEIWVFLRITHPVGCTIKAILSYGFYKIVVLVKFKR
ncbi:hypothetical protein ADIS_1533 [Lunatimonas lonarensis]|uniref:Uncharacterized protein n=1 Tax=Lunatimonas lonarensis TaxID=1232681 RepID=R7ZVF0_9BACT|nr:hypothetical protein ADIS_1533 [Lunatimonas lonarensis]